MTPGQVARYGALGLPLAFGALPIYLFVPDLYARSGLLSLSAIGVILLLARLLDAVADPVLGWLVDRHPRRPILYAALLPFLLGFFALFMPPQGGGVDPGWWLFLTLFVCTLGFSAAMIAYQAWGADLGEDTPARLRLTGAREFFILAGVVIAAVIPTAVATEPAAGMRALPWFLALFLLMALAFAWRLPRGQQQTDHTLITARLRAAFADTLYGRLLLVFFANGIASAFPATLFVFYVADVLGAADKTGMLLGSYFLAAALAVPLWVRCAERVGRPVTWMLSMGLAMAAFAGAGLLGPGDWPLFLVICVVSGAAVGTDLTIPASIVADLGERRGMTGTYFGIWNFLAKINLALAAGIALPVLGMFGYTPGEQAHAEVLIAAYVLLPLVLKLLALALLLRWRRELGIVASHAASP